MNAKAGAQSACRHCGTFFTPGGRLTDFCCAGCQFVHRLINDSGLERFYALKGKRSLAPVKSLVFQNRDYTWLEEARAGAEAAAEEKGGRVSLDLDVQGIACVACVWLIENIFRRQAGGLRIDLNAHLGQLRVWWTPGKFDFQKFAAELQQFGYVLGPHSGDARRGAGSRDLVLRMGLCAAFALNAMAFTLPRYLGMRPEFELARLFQLITVLSATFCLLIGGSYFFRRAWEGIRRGRLHIDTPISLGILFAYGGSMAGWFLGVEELLYFDFIGIFIFLMLLGRWLQQIAVEKNRHRVLAGDTRPNRVRCYKSAEAREGEGEMVEVERLGRGDLIGIKAGQVVPVRGELRSGDAELSMEWINGEPEARHWRRGGMIPAGAINIGRGELRLRAEERYEESLLAKLMAPAEGAAFRNLKLETVLRIYLAIVLGLGLVGGMVWFLAAGDPAKGLQVAISVLVVSCPCALGIAIPLADEMAVIVLRKSGLFVRNWDLWARLAKVRRIIFDKTGTLTLEVPELINAEVLDALGSKEKDALRFLVRDSLHPFSRSIREALAAETDAPSWSSVTMEPEEIPGSGVRAKDADGVCWTLGKAPGREASRRCADGSTVDCVLQRDGEVLAAFRFREALRPGAPEEIERLGRRGYEVCILSGDREEKVRALGRDLGLSPDNCFGRHDPEEKAAWVRAREPGKTLYIGDGANDSLAFGEALCSGTPAVESAVLQGKSDFYFLGRGVRALRELLEIAERRKRTVARVFGFSVSYNVLAVGLCLAGWMNPLWAAVLMPVSSLVSLALVSLSLGRT